TRIRCIFLCSFRFQKLTLRFLVHQKALRLPVRVFRTQFCKLRHNILGTCINDRYEKTLRFPWEAEAVPAENRRVLTSQFTSNTKMKATKFSREKLLFMIHFSLLG